jgi:hypothetical protein
MRNNLNYLMKEWTPTEWREASEEAILYIDASHVLK